jgi:hypothetical protein
MLAPPTGRHTAVGWEEVYPQGGGKVTHMYVGYFHNLKVTATSLEKWGPQSFPRLITPKLFDSFRQFLIKFQLLLGGCTS